MKQFQRLRLASLFSLRKSKSDQPGHCPKPTWKCFSFEEINHATKNFSSDSIVGKGGCADVYRGVLKDGRKIAVKRLSKKYDDERKEKHFLSEIGTICHVRHSNVVPLVGCCVENGLYLVFQLSSNGTVASALHGSKLPVLGWSVRYKIAVGTARGINYLHQGCTRRIIHRDIKSSNILLSEDFEPMIADFGLAKWLPTQWTHHSIALIEGSFGHLAPEYITHGVVDEKTDVFAFGVFLIELISGRKPANGGHQSLHQWAKPLLNVKEKAKLLDPRLKGAFDSVQLENVSFAASLCIRAVPSERPPMADILGLMENGTKDGLNRKIARDEDLTQCFVIEELERDIDDSSSSSVQDFISF